MKARELPFRYLEQEVCDKCGDACSTVSRTGRDRSEFWGTPVYHEWEELTSDCCGAGVSTQVLCSYCDKLLGTPDEITVVGHRCERMPRFNATMKLVGAA